MLIEKHLEDDPLTLALSGIPPAVCTQIDYLQRCRLKIPAWFHARCIVPPLSYEQCSSEASCKGKIFSGKLCIDLTCGLGVDSWHFSHSFEKVVSVEKDPFLAGLAVYNFNRLGRSNISVVNDSAEHFAENYSGPKADLIYVDPSRRSGGKKVFLFGDCLPDVTQLLPRLRQLAGRIVIKASPLFDVEEAFRLFEGCQVQVVSVENECKELLICLDGEASEEAGTVKITMIGKQSKPKEFVFKTGQYKAGESACKESGQRNIVADFSRYGFVYIPDAAFYKSRMLPALAANVYSGTDAVATGEGGVILSNEPLPDFPGQSYRIRSVLPYRPKHIKAFLQKNGIDGFTLLKRNFPYETSTIRKAVGLKEGESGTLLFTSAGKQLVALWVEKI